MLTAEEHVILRKVLSSNHDRETQNIYLDELREMMGDERFDKFMQMGRMMFAPKK